MTPAKIASEIAFQDRPSLVNQKVWKRHKNRAAWRRMVGIAAFIIGVAWVAGLTLGGILAFATK